MKLTGRQSKNVIIPDAKDYGKGDVDQRAAFSKRLKAKIPLVDMPAETGTRVGTLEPGMDTSSDAPFLQHFQKDN